MCRASSLLQVASLRNLFWLFPLGLLVFKPSHRFFERDAAGLFRTFREKSHKWLTLAKLRHLALKLIGRLEHKNRAVFCYYMYGFRCSSLKEFF